MFSDYDIYMYMLGNETTSDYLLHSFLVSKIKKILDTFFIQT